MCLCVQRLDISPFQNIIWGKGIFEKNTKHTIYQVMQHCNVYAQLVKHMYCLLAGKINASKSSYYSIVAWHARRIYNGTLPSGKQHQAYKAIKRKGLR